MAGILADKATPVDGQLLVWLDQDQGRIVLAHLGGGRGYHAPDDSVDEAQVGGKILLSRGRHALADHAVEDSSGVLEVLTDDQVERGNLPGLEAAADPCSDEGSDHRQGAAHRPR